MEFLHLVLPANGYREAWSEITGMDDMGVISRLSDVLANKMKVNIKSFSMTGSEGHFEGRIGVEVQNKEQLDTIISELKRLEVVNTVSRVS